LFIACENCAYLTSTPSRVGCVKKSGRALSRRGSGAFLLVSRNSADPVDPGRILGSVPGLARARERWEDCHSRHARYARYCWEFVGICLAIGRGSQMPRNDAKLLGYLVGIVQLMFTISPPLLAHDFPMLCPPCMIRPTSYFDSLDSLRFELGQTTEGGGETIRYWLGWFRLSGALFRGC